MAALYANENFPSQVVHALRRLGHDVLTTLEAGQANRAVPDAEVLYYATGHRRATLTLNRRDFARLHAQVPDHAGIVVCTPDPDPDAQAARIHQAIVTAPVLAGHLIRVTRRG